MRCVPEIAGDVLETKKSLLRRSEMLEFVEADDAFSSVGGMDNLKRWLAQRRGSWEDSAREFGLEPPHGVIILGVQGCGKSLCARAVAGEWKLPLVKFDTAAVYDKYIGETEKRIRKVFEVAEGLAPCVLWIDELEKVFAGSGPDSASADAGVSSRLLASFLSWMQDRKAPVFVAATCNNVTALPPELIRKGRFDELFFVDLPNQAERKQIFSIQLARRKRNPAEFDLDRVAAAAKGYSGAEIDAAVQTALYAAFSEKKPLTTQFLLDALAQTVPLSTTRAEEIDALREWARTRAVPASAAGESAMIALAIDSHPAAGYALRNGSDLPSGHEHSGLVPSRSIILFCLQSGRGVSLSRSDAGQRLALLGWTAEAAVPTWPIAATTWFIEETE